MTPAASKPARGTLKRERNRKRRRKTQGRRSCVGFVRAEDKTCRYLWTQDCQVRGGQVQYEYEHLRSFGVCDENPYRSKGGDPTDPQETLLACKSCHDAKHANEFHVHYLTSDGARGAIETCHGPRKACGKPVWLVERAA